MATTSIWGDVVAHVSASEVEVLIPAGVDAHEYQPSAAQIARLLAADLIIANGLGLEDGLDDVLRTAVQEGVEVLYLAEHLDPIALRDASSPEALDPHVWFDPIRVGEAAVLIAETLTRLDPAGGYEARAIAFQTDMETTDLQVEAILEQVDSRSLVTNHDTLGYFAERYEFDVVGVVVPGGTSLGEPSSADLARLISTIEELAVRAIFAETTQPRALADVVAAEVGHDVAVVELHTESLQTSGPAVTLAGMLLENARLIAAALTVPAEP